MHKLRIKGYPVHLNEQKQRSKSATNMLSKEWIKLSNEEKKGFSGYTEPFLMESYVKILMYREIIIKNEIFFQLVFNKTPFYPEGGGQVGDKGELISDDKIISIIDTKKENNLILHLVDNLPKNLDKEYLVKVNTEKRKLSSRNHTATHLLHHELIKILGVHVEQKGSLVNSKYLRFDFSHFEKVSEEDLKKIESNVNRKIFASINLDEKLNISFDKAKSIGAIALFGEKYEDLVRVIKFGDSIELCGGTHVQNTSEIGVFKILSESSVASGVRRIEAVTSFGAFSYLKSILSDFNQVKSIIKNTQNPVTAIKNLISDNKRLKDKINELENKEIVAIKENLLKSIKKINNVNTLISSTNVSVKLLKNISFDLLRDSEKLFLALFSTDGDKVIFNLGISKDLIKHKNWKANDLIKYFSKDIEGAGGGQDFFASASGKKAENITLVINKINSFLLEN